VIWSELTIDNHNIESYNAVLWGDNDSDVFTVRDQAECQREVAEEKIQVSSQFCMHLRYTKECEIKF